LQKSAAGGAPGAGHAPVTHRAPSGAHPGGGPSGGGGAGGYLPSNAGGQHIHYHQNVTVHGSVTSEGDLASRLQDVFVTRSTNNWRSGLVAPGRTV
jgi:hypothetical protein